MKYFLSGLMGLFLVMSFYSKAQGTQIETIAVLKVENLNDITLKQLEGVISSDIEVFLDYSCMWSGILVFKINSPYNGEGDIQQIIRSKLSKTGLKNPSFLHIGSRELSETSKC